MRWWSTVSIYEQEKRDDENENDFSLEQIPVCSVLTIILLDIFTLTFIRIATHSNSIRHLWVFVLENRYLQDFS